jgi:hypothetical protein
MTEPADRLTRAAEAVAGRRRLTQHGQQCPVWVRREQGAVIGQCACWVLRGAREDARVALAAADGAEPRVRAWSRDP